MNKVSFISSVVTAALVLSLAADAGAQDVPEAISFTARLTDADGEPITGPVDIKVAIYDAGSGGALIWEEDMVQVDADASGVLVHELGNQPDAEPLDAAVFGGQPLYLDVTINGEVLAPRVPILTVPYAFRASVANTAETLGDLEPGDVALADHSHDATYLRRGPDQSCPDGQFAVGLEDNGGVPELICQEDTVYTAGAGLSLVDNQFFIGAAQITSSMVDNQSLTSSDLAEGSVGTSEIADGTITSQDLASNSVVGSKIADGAVNSDTIDNGSITADDLATDSVRGAEIQDGSISAEDIGADEVGSSEIAPGAVRASELKGGGVAVYRQNAGCSPFGNPVFAQVAIDEACGSLQCGSSSYYSCASGNNSASCNAGFSQLCGNTLLGYLAAP